MIADRDEGLMLKSLAHGLIAGYIGTAAMDASQASLIPWISSALASLRSSDMHAHVAPPAPAASDDESEQPLSSLEEVARRGADLLGMQLSRDELTTWGNRVHWVYGTQWGIAYTLMRQRPGPASGLLFGAALWLVSDELLLWALGIAKAPNNYPLSSHLQALAAHCVYGTVVGTTVRGLQAR
jgi:hypothetical protein